MNPSIALQRTVSFYTRDFHAESQERDGSRFLVYLRPRPDERVEAWFHNHRSDNGRSLFAPKDPADRDDAFLECADEAEAMELLTQLQTEVNRSDV